MRRTTLAYIEKNNCYLMLLRNKKEQDINRGKWIGVGGKLEAGETPDEGMKREILEETGLTVTDFRFEGLVHFLPEKYEDEEMYLYTVQEFSGEVDYSCSEGTLKWIPKEEILSLNLWEGDPYFLGKILEGPSKPFHMSLVYDAEDHIAEVRTLSDVMNIETSSLLSCPHGFSNRLGGVSSGIFYSCNLGLNREDAKEDTIENWHRFFEAVEHAHLARTGVFCTTSEASVPGRYEDANRTERNSSECDSTPAKGSDAAEPRTTKFTGLSSLGDIPFVRGQQVHGNPVHLATKKDARPCYGPGEMISADGYVTKEKNLPLAIFTADCVPVLLQDPVAGVIGALHCGWKPTVADLEGQAITTMLGQGATPENIRVAIGPAIEQCCFEVGPEVVEACRNLLSNTPAEASVDSSPDVSIEASPTGLSDFPFAIPSNREGHFLLDLKGVVRERLLQLGILENHIELVGTCTRCHPEKYYSHRYASGQNRGSLACIIWQ